MPGIDSLVQRLPLVLDGKVDDRRRPSEGRRAGACLERVGSRGPSERQLHVGVRIDTARDDEATLRVDDAIGVDVDRSGDHGYRSILDEEIGPVIVDRRHDAAILDDSSHLQAPSR